jgi:hypothetical protein
MYQFQALGLINKNSDGLWRLTPHGEFKLSELLAIRRSQSAVIKPSKNKARTKKSMQ